MKKKTQKLKLSKETVRKLEDGLLVKAAGGATSECASYPSCRICWDQPVTEGC